MWLSGNSTLIDKKQSERLTRDQVTDELLASLTSPFQGLKILEL